MKKIIIIIIAIIFAEISIFAIVTKSRNKIEETPKDNNIVTTTTTTTKKVETETEPDEYEEQEDDNENEEEDSDMEENTEEEKESTTTKKVTIKKNTTAKKTQPKTTTTEKTTVSNLNVTQKTTTPTTTKKKVNSDEEIATWAFNYVFHKGQIDYKGADKEKYCICIAEYVAGLSNDIKNTDCYDVTSKTNIVLGYYLDVNCKSGNCDRYKQNLDKDLCKDAK